MVQGYGLLTELLLPSGLDLWSMPVVVDAIELKLYRLSGCMDRQTDRQTDRVTE